MKNIEILLTITLSKQLFIDPKRIRLLKEIQYCGSINQAAKNANVSYKSAWDHLQAMDEISPKPLLERNTGGKNGGGTQLTTYAQRLLQLYDLLEKTQEKAFHILQDENIPLNSLLSATSRFSLQSSARNQFLGQIKNLHTDGIQSLVEIEIKGLSQPLYASITEKSAVRLQLFLDKEVIVMIKAPWVEINPTHVPKFNFITAKIETILDQNNCQEILFTTANGLQFCATTVSSLKLKQGELANIYIDPENILLVTLY